MVEVKTNRYLTLIASIFVTLCVGAVYAFSVFAGPLGKNFGWSKDIVMMAFTINSAISPIPMILGGKLLDKGWAKQSILVGGIMFGLGFVLTSFAQTPTHLYISYGLIVGLGQGIAYSGVLGNIVRFFPDRRGLASGLVTAGFGAATILAAPIANSLIETGGVLYAFQMMGFAYLAIAVVAGLCIRMAPAGFKPAGWTPPAASPQNTGVNVAWKDMLKSPKFYLIAAMFTIGALSGMMITANASSIGQGMFGLTPKVAAQYVSLYALSNCLGRVFWGSTSDKLGRYNTLICIYAVIAVMLLLLANASSTTGFAIALVGIGLCFGGTLGIFPSIVAENFGMKFFGVNYGITFIGYSLAGFFGPRIAVQIAAANNGSFINAFYIAMGCGVVGIVLTLIFKQMIKKTAAAA